MNNADNDPKSWATDHVPLQDTLRCRMRVSGRLWWEQQHHGQGINPYNDTYRR